MSVLKKHNNLMQQRLANVFVERIRSGHWLPNSRLPSVRTLAAEYEVAPGTVSKALNILQLENYVVINRGSGTYVNPPQLWNENSDSEIQCTDKIWNSDALPHKILHFLFYTDIMDEEKNTYDSYNLLHYSKIICYMQEEAEKANMLLRIGNAAKIKSILEKANRENTCGIIYMPISIHPTDLEWSTLQFPKVLFSIGEKSLDSNYVTPDNYQGGCIAAKYMLAKCPAQYIISAPVIHKNYLGDRPYRERMQGFIDVCRLSERMEPKILNLENVDSLDDTLENIMQYPREARPGLVFLGNNFSSSSVDKKLKSYIGDKYYEQLDVLSFNDYQNNISVDCATVVFSLRQFCREVIDLIRKASHFPEDTPIRVKIPMKLKLPENMEK